MSKVTVLTAQVPAELVTPLRAAARSADRSLAAEIRCAIRNHLSTSSATAENCGAAPASDGGRHERQ